MGQKQKRRNEMPARLLVHGGLEGASQYERAPSFGISRPLAEVSADKLKDTLLALQVEGRIPDKPRGMVRNALAITLLSRRAVTKAMRGVADYDLELARALMQSNPACADRNETITVKRGEVRPFGQRLIYATVESITIQGEMWAANNAVAIAGLRSLSRVIRSIEPHVSLVDAGRRSRFSNDECARMSRALDRVLPAEFDVEPWDSHPFDILPAEETDLDAEYCS